MYIYIYIEYVYIYIMYLTINIDIYIYVYDSVFPTKNQRLLEKGRDWDRFRRTRQAPLILCI